MYYNRDLLKKFGAPLPDSGQLGQAQFVELLRKAAASGTTAVVAGVGDRPYPGAFLVHEPLLKKLGKEDYAKLLKGQLAWTDPRVVDVLRWVRAAFVETKALPRDFTTLKLGDAHYYFHTKPGGLMFPMGSFYPSRAFNPTDKGGEPANFPLGIMQFPAMDGGRCNHCKTIAVGGSYVVNAASKNPRLAVAVLNEMATVEMGTRWLRETLVQTGIKSDASKVSGERAYYFRDLERASQGVEYFIGLPSQHLTGQAKEVFAQVMNVALPAGLIGPEDAARRMQAAMAAK
jgi:multiple sugar transport system substrate-binding protein